MEIRRPAAPSDIRIDHLSSDLLAEMFRRMTLIRRFELRVNELFLRGEMPGTIHLSHGQEATAVGACLALDPDDVITLTHRGHGQAIAKGVSSRSLMAELFGKATGCCAGKGGSLHVGDISVGALPAIAIVGASSPLAAGMAFAFQRDGSERVVGNFFGDGSANKGDWHEAMNLAAIWSLPVVFICENNLWAVSTHITDMMKVDYVSERAAAYGMPGVTVYGNDPGTVYDAIKTAADRARSGGGPSLVECLTYRRGGHKRDDPATYRPTEEVEAWLAADPIDGFRTTLLADGRLTESALLEMETNVDSELDDAVDFARSSDVPAEAEALTDVYA